MDKSTQPVRTSSLKSKPPVEPLLGTPVRQPLVKKARSEVDESMGAEGSGSVSSASGGLVGGFAAVGPARGPIVLDDVPAFPGLAPAAPVGGGVGGVGGSGVVGGGGNDGVFPDLGAVTTEDEMQAFSMRQAMNEIVKITSAFLIRTKISILSLPSCPST